MGSETLRFVVKAKDEASRVLKGVGGSFGALGKLAKVGMAIAAAGVMVLIAAVTALVGWLFSAKKAYEAWMLNLTKTQRLTGMSAKGVSLLAGQLRLSGVDATKAQAGLGIFAKTLDAARRGTAAAKDAFSRLHVSLRDSDGKLRTINDVLPQVRDRLSRIKDAATRAGVSAKLFGKGFKEMGPWLTKSAEKMREYAKFTKSLGMEMGAKAMKNFSAYRENQKKMSFAWDAIKINAYGALVPIMTMLAGPVVKALQKAAGWMGKFRRLAEKKGLKTAVEEMIPGVKQAEKWWRRNEKDIRAVIKAIGSAAKFLIKWLPILSRIQSWFNKWANPITITIRLVKAAWGQAQKLWDMVKSVGSALKNWSTSAIDAVKSAVSTLVSWLTSAWNLIVKIKDALAAGGLKPGSGQGGGGGGRGGLGDTGPATGGITVGPMSGYPVTLHGIERVTSLNGNKATPNRVYDYGDAPAIGGGGVTFNNCNFSAHTPKEIADSVVSAIANKQRRNLRVRPA